MENDNRNEKMKQKFYDLFFSLSRKLEECDDEMIPSIIGSMLDIYTLFRKLD